MSELKEELVKDVTDENGLTEKDRAFLDVLFDKCGGNVRRAMDEVGFSKSVPTSFVTNKLAKHIRDRSKEFLVSNTGKAVINLVNVLDDPNTPGAKNVLSAAQQILDRGGVFKEEDVKVTEIRNMFILPAKDERDNDE